MMKIKVGILKNESPNDHKLWIEACKKKSESLDYVVIDITKNDWLDNIEKAGCDLLLTRPPGLVSAFKQLYDERIWILKNILKKNIYPSFQEIFIYENKRLLAYWLMANKLPHPKTFVSYYIEEAIAFLNKTKFPIVAKTNIGASGIGIEILKNENDAINYVERIFSATGQNKRSGPKLFKGSIIKKFRKAIFQKGFLKNRILEYKSMGQDNQKGFLLFQEYIPHEYEWRCVVIDDSYFAHKKLVKKEKASGTLLKSYDNPPIELFEFIKDLKDKTGITSSAIDLFEYQGKYLVNEIQSFFGQSDPYQMMVNGKPGRYKSLNNQWVFEEGMFNSNQNYDLRLDHALKIVKK